MLKKNKKFPAHALVEHYEYPETEMMVPSVQDCKSNQIFQRIDLI